MKRTLFGPLATLATLLLIACGGSIGQPTPTVDATQPAFVTATPEPTPTPSPTPDPAKAVRVIRFAPGELIAGIDHGAFFMDTDTGNVEAIVLNTTAPYISYLVSPDNRWVLARSDEASALYDRQAGRVIPPGEILDGVHRTPDMYLLNGFLVVDAGPDPSGGEGESYIILDSKLEELARFILDPKPIRRGELTFQQSRDGGTALLVTGDSFRVLDLETGSLSPLLGVPPPPDSRLSAITEHGLVVTIVIPTPNDRVPARCAIWAVGWSGDPTTRVSVEACIPVFLRTPPEISPDGRFALIRRALAQEDTTGVGDNPLLGAIYVHDVATGKALFRINGAVLPEADSIGGSHWLADSSGFVVETVGGQTVVTANGEWTSIKLPQSGRPVPSPTDLRLFALGRAGGVYNAETERIVKANLDLSLGHIDPWGADDDEIRFVVPEGGHDGAAILPVAAPAIQFPPFDDDLLVAGEGDCLNVRDSPVVDAATATCIPDGTRVAPYSVPLTDLFPEFNTDDTYRTTVQFDRGGCRSLGQRPCLWVSVETPSGQTGWVAAEYLRWPGISPGETQ
jgi:hypothetical protein